METFDIVLHLTTIGTANADDSSYVAPVYQRDVVQVVGLWRERDHPRLALLESLINSYKRSFPVDFTCKRRRHALLGLISRIFFQDRTRDEFIVTTVMNLSMTGFSLQTRPLASVNCPKADLCDRPVFGDLSRSPRPRRAGVRVPDSMAAVFFSPVPNDTHDHIVADNSKQDNVASTTKRRDELTQTAVAKLRLAAEAGRPGQQARALASRGRAGDVPWSGVSRQPRQIEDYMLSAALPIAEWAQYP